MAGKYAARLKRRIDYGECGLPERVDNKRVMSNKLKKICQIIEESDYIVVHTGAGISTSCGIPDFRGPKGVWTLEEKGIETDLKTDTPWESVKPSYTHMALLALYKVGKVKFIVSQNVDGLHLRSGFPRECLAELHGNVFKEVCEKCKTEYYRNFDVGGIGFKHTGRSCSQKYCDGKLIDDLLDWDDALPERELKISEEHCKSATLSLCLGTSLRVTPANELPVYTTQQKQQGGKLVIVNLQQTPKDEYANLKIHGYCDDIMKEVIKLPK
eukprot:TRINITY_DN2437_c0_g1_i5.p1 TRINITY_DN2437_c0_g1~~TRINITY_DN2437_c0_g1_i5.p1  ORF type:complete len:270 (+),score=49.69 TRINITY_DN2437_c0_g1_i5:2-811(+)